MREEIIFAGDFLKELAFRGIRRIPFQTQRYKEALKSVKEELEKENQLIYPLETLLTSKVITGDFSRMDVAIQHYLGREIQAISPQYDEIMISISASKSKEVKDRLVKKFTDIFIEKLCL